jgi:gamma-glutamylcyclotransferase (GGCT)/AIG2-like uncharacterized protein YtfP
MTGRSGTSALFAYGSLQLAEVMEAVTGALFSALPARLPGHRRRALRGRSYPGIVADPHESTDGMLWRGLDAEALEILDLFEGEPYARVSCTVRPLAAPPCEAFVYVIRDEHAHLMSDQPWELRGFRDDALRLFLDQCRAFARDVRAGARWRAPD